MYKVEYLPSADIDIEDIEKALEQYSLSAADDFGDAVVRQTSNLVDFPYMYPVSEYDDDLHSMGLPYKYILFYRVNEPKKLVQVYRVLHGMRDLGNVL